MTKRSPALVAAQKRYRAKKLLEGREQLPGSLVPDDVAKIIKGIIKRGEADSTSGAYWYAVRKFDKKR